MSLHIPDFIALFGFLFLSYRLYQKSRKQYPPGPKGLPIFGNLYDQPTDEPWVHYKEMGKKYNSELLYFDIAGSPMVIVNSLRVARDLLEKRHKLYSDRPPYTMLTELIGFKWDYGFNDYGEEWKKASTLLIREFAPVQMNEYHKPIMGDSSRYLLGKLLEKPQNRHSHIRHTSGRTILTVCYGIMAKDENDPYVARAEKATQAVSLAGNPGSFLVDWFPILKYVPEWLPGAGFKRKSNEWRKDVVTMPQNMMDFLRNAMKNGNPPSSMASRNLQKMQDEGTLNSENEDRLTNVCAATYVGGSDSTVAGLESFFLLMLQYTEVMKKAQQQIDSVVGRERLPDFSDETKLPYITAILKETLRLRPLAPLANAHYIKTEDVYEGYYIPKNSTVIPNSWAILRDPELYGADADEFRPERFLREDGTLNPDVMPPDAGFGFGRRICPGKMFAQHSLFMNIASILWAFDLETIPGREPSGRYINGMVTAPEPFDCTIKPRHESVPGLIHSALALA